MARRWKRDYRVERDTSAWLMTFSDMTVLCLTFFVLLYSFSNLDASKWKSVVKSLQGALGLINGGNNVIGDSNLNNPELQGNVNINDDDMGMFLEYQQEIKELRDVQEKLTEYLGESDLNGQVSTSIDERGLVLRFADSVLFDKGKADLRENSKELLLNVALILKDIDNPIRIEGHTDDLPISTTRFPSNWELSTSRATTVLKDMINQGIFGERLSAIGYGEYHPLVPNDNENNRRKNRRVDIVILRDSLANIEPK